jgi:hypothetical protein
MYFILLSALIGVHEITGKSSLMTDIFIFPEETAIPCDTHLSAAADIRETHIMMMYMQNILLKII